MNLSTKEDGQQRNDFRYSSSQVTKQYGAYTATPAKKTTSTISLKSRTTRVFNFTSIG